MKLASVLAAVALAANASHAGLPVDTSPALDASVANVASPIPDTSSDTTANDVPQVSYPDEDCPNPKKVPHCCAHVRFRNKVARAQNCHASTFWPAAPSSPLWLPWPGGSVLVVTKGEDVKLTAPK